MDTIALIESQPLKNSDLREEKSAKKLSVATGSVTSEDTIIVQECYPCLANFQYILSSVGIVVIVVIMVCMFMRMFTPTPRD